MPRRTLLAALLIPLAFSGLTPSCLDSGETGTLGLTDVYIVLLTAKGQEFDRQKGQEVGADLYMTKPFDPDALLQKARDVLGL